MPGSMISHVAIAKWFTGVVASVDDRRAWARMRLRVRDLADIACDFRMKVVGFRRESRVASQKWSAKGVVNQRPRSRLTAYC